MLKDGGLNNAVQRIFPYMAISANCDLACHTGRYFVVGQGASYRTASHFSSIATTSLISQSLSVTPAAMAGVTFSVL